MSEQTRAWIYRIATPVNALLIAYGVYDAQDGALWLALVGAVLTGGLAAYNTSTS
jgi:hypothetical protein